MKIVRTEFLIRAGEFGRSTELDETLGEVYDAIQEVQWPPHSGQFVLYPQKKGNGVKPIKEGCMLFLEAAGWELEKPMRILKEGKKRPGALDAVKTLSGGGLFVVEWETGNISSSHRAMNKMLIGIEEGSLLGGILILPSGAMYPYLTDRVGNYPELEPYFPAWRRGSVRNGALAVIAIQQDGLSENVPKIEKGTDGRALV